MRKEHRAILYHCQQNGGTVTLGELVVFMGNKYHNGASRYLGQICRTMIKNGQLVRVKPGLFAIPEQQNETTNTR